MAIRILRREFILTVTGAMAAWPLAARAQQQAMPVVGYIDAGSPEPAAQLVSALRGGLGEIGFVEGRNVALEWRTISMSGCRNWRPIWFIVAWQ